MTNQRKYISYSYAWSRLRAAREQGFHLEAVTIAESIISDRLLSYVLGVYPAAKVDAKSGLGKLVVLWRRLAGAALRSSNGDDLGRDVDAWRKRRNEVVHGMVKTAPGTPTRPVDEFAAVAEETAKDAVRVARRVSSWHALQLRSARRRQSKR